MNGDDPVFNRPSHNRTQAYGDPLLGATLKGTYRVLRKVAEGGMGIVYEGEHVRLRRRVAIKILMTQYSRHPEVLARFRREAEVVGSLGHPNIVQVFDVDETESGDPFFVMEFLEGETLAQRLDREPRQTVATACKIAIQTAKALKSTHEKGIVHRDLKPENIFLVRTIGEGDFVKVLDYGISKVRGGLGKKLTQDNSVVGTPLYMAPEQARANADVDERADQFALAAIVYEMLAGVSPFAGNDTVDILQKVLNAEPTPLEQIASWVPSSVAAVIKRALSRERDERFPNVSDFAQALGVAAAHTEARAEPLPAPGSVAPTPASEARTLPSSKPPPRAAPESPAPPPPHPMLSSVPPSNPRVEVPPSNLPSSRAFGSSPPNPADANSERAEQLFYDMRQAFRNERLDEAVGHAEKLLELGMFGRDPGVYRVLRLALPIIDRVFEMRVGSPERRLTVTAAGRDPARLNLSTKAAFVLSCADGGATVQEVLDACGIPKRDAIRLLAGLLRRAALVAE